MNEQQNHQLPTWFWVVAAITLVWNLMGVAAFVSTMMITPEALAQLPPAEAELYTSTPTWANAAFGFAVLGGAMGCVGLLLRKAWAKILLVVSLLGVLIQMFHAFFISNSLEVFGPGGMVMPVMVIVIAVALVWFADFAKSRAWIA